MKGLSVIIFSLLLHTMSCRTTKINNRSIEYYKGITPIQVSYAELVHNKAKYHGKVIETEGYCSFGFENSCLYYDSTSFDYSKTLDYLPYFAILWIDFHSSLGHLSSYTKNNSYVKVKGVFDTTRHGHLGAYYAEIYGISHIEETTKKR